MRQGLFIVLEGSDGSGKTTQFKLLSERLRAAGYVVDVYDFPRYEQPSSYFVQRYLNGEYGPASEISPYTASLFYALDRYEAAPLVRQSLADGKIVLANRYTGSNMAHQGAKFKNAGEQRGFFMWADSLEFQLLGIPRPHINFFLRMPADVAYELIKNKAARSYTSKSHDEHEADIEHLRSSVATYDMLCQLFPKDFKAIQCAKNGKILSITEINNRIWQALKPLLPEPPHSGRAAVVTLEEKNKPARDKKIDEGTDSPKSTQLKDISLLALHNLLSIDGLNINYRLKWPPDGSKVRLNYYIPPQMPAPLTKKYRVIIDEIINLNNRMAKKIKKERPSLLNATVPLAALVNAEISAGSSSLKSLIARASSSDLPEVRQLGVKYGTGRSSQPEALKQIIKQLTEVALPHQYADSGEYIKLLESLPRNEIDLLVDSLYAHSNFGRDEIAAEIDHWTYQKKANALKSIIRQNPGLLLDKLRYHFDIVDSYLLLKELLEPPALNELRLQQPTPRYGYEVPKEAEEEGIDANFIKCFDLSLELANQMQSAGLEQLAGYAILLGHRQRWQFSLGGNRVFEYPKLADKIAEVHPLVYEAVKTKTQAPKNNQQQSRRRRAKQKR